MCKNTRERQTSIFAYKIYYKPNMAQAYNKSFYDKRHQRTVYSAEKILDLVIENIPTIKSVADVGCGVGTWLSVFKTKGAEKVLGVDGPWVKQEVLQIEQDEFLLHDVKQPVPVDHKFDLAISLEVAEHLPEESADTIVDSLCSLSDYVLFSAAIPFQRGRQHINMQWQEYWVQKFEERKYIVYDFVREAIWGDSEIPVWYRQNCFLFVNEKKADTVKADPSQKNFISVVHPDYFVWLIKRRPINAIKRFFGAKLSR